MKVPRRLLALVCAGLTATVAAAPASASNAEVRIRRLDPTSFPTVSVTVSVSGGISPRALRLSENGTPVNTVAPRLLGTTGGAVQVVLAIDTSDSVRGAPLAAAVSAAEAFLQQVPDGIDVGILSFSNHPRILVPIGSSRTQASGILASLSKTQFGTSLYDAVDTATGMFAEGGQHNVILLTDGTDVGSTNTLASSLRTAQEAHVTIFSIGLNPQPGSAAVLTRLAQSTGGAYVGSTQADLATTYERLGSELSHQYVLTYRSLGKPGTQASVTVSAGTASDTASLLLPKPAQPAAVEGYQPPGPPLLSGPGGLGVVVLMTFLAAFVLVALTLNSAGRVRRRQELARRIGVEPARTTGEPASDRGIAGLIPQSVADLGERMAQSGGFAVELDRKLDRAGMPLTPGEFVAGTGAVAVVGLILGGLFFSSSLWVPLVLGVLFGVVPTVYVIVAAKLRTKELQGQLPDTLMILASSLRAGHSFAQALEMVAQEIGEPGSIEFGRVVAEVRLGRSVEEAMTAMANRIGSEDFHWAVLALNIQREVGGNLAEILDTVAATLRERQVLRRQVRALAAEGQLSIYILAALPFVLALYIAKVNPGYLNLLFTNSLGQVASIVAGVLMAIGIVWMRRTVRIDV